MAPLVGPRVIGVCRAAPGGGEETKMLSLKTSKRRRGSKEGSPAEKRAEELEKPTEVPSWEDEVDYFASEEWENTIGEEEEMYLANTREELYELIMRKETFGSKVTKKRSEKLLELMHSLIEYGRENVGSLQLYEGKEKDEEEGPYEQSKVCQLTKVIAFQQRRMEWLFEEIRGRFLRVKLASTAKGERMKALEEENRTLRKSLEVVERERGELLIRQDSRSGLSVERKDASVSTEAEAPEVERTGSQDPPPLVELPRGWRGALESLIEEKVKELLSLAGVVRDGKTGGETIPPPESGEGHAPRATSTWAEVVGRRRRRGRESPPLSGDGTLPMCKEARAPGGVPPPVERTTGEKREPPHKSARREGRKRDRAWPVLPKTAAVVLSASVGMETACAELLKRAKEVISIKEMGIPPLEVSRARAGGLILKVPGHSPREGADLLAASLSGLAGEMGVRVTRPIKRADARVSGIEASSTEEDVMAAIASATGCARNDLRCGRIRRGPAGVGSLWLQCPLEVAVQLARARGVEVGWSRVAVELLRDRPLRCYRCLEVGHVGARCTSEVDRSGRCYRCGSTGHKVEGCEARVPRCPLCVDKGKPYQHGLGAAGCCNDIPPLTRENSGGGGEPAILAASSNAG